MKASGKSIGIFCVLAFVPVWAACAAIMIFGAPGGAGLTVIFAMFMFMPAIASILTRLICREGFQNMFLRPRFKGHIGLYLIAWFLPAILTILGAAVYFLLFSESFDGTFSILTGQGVASDQIPAMLVGTFITMLLGPVLNLIPAFGEELGWRGYLLQKLNTRLRPVGAALLTGAIWGLWHAPMIALGHNYGFGYWGYPVTGILLMTLFCMAFGAFLAFLTQRTQSAIPAGLAHGGLNAVASIGALFCLPGYNALLGPYPMGIVAGIPTILAGALFLILLWRGRDTAPTDAQEEALPVEAD